MTLNGVMAVNLRYFTEFWGFEGQLRQSVKIIPKPSAKMM